YTFVDSSGGSNMNPDPNDPDARRAQIDDLPLEGLSRRAYNLVGVYEKGPLSVRLAYNWRSRYLLTASETNLQLPMWADDFGQLDGSFFYNINDNIQIGIQANNLTDAITKVLMGPRPYADGYIDETLYPRSYFMNDRRYSAVLRARLEQAESHARGGDRAGCCAVAASCWCFDKMGGWGARVGPHPSPPPQAGEGGKAGRLLAPTPAC